MNPKILFLAAAISLPMFLANCAKTIDRPGDLEVDSRVEPRKHEPGNILNYGRVRTTAN